LDDDFERIFCAEWGDFHYIVKGRDVKGELILEGGWQNNRRMGMHKIHRFIENVFEELDTVGEWYFDKTAKTLFFYPPQNENLKAARIETLNLVITQDVTKDRPFVNLVSLQQLKYVRDALNVNFNMQDS
jgi:hypothetical protein